MKSTVILFCVFLMLYFLSIPAEAQNEPDPRLRPYINVLKTQGEDPAQFVLKQLESVDLVIFDDAWHPGKEVFDFYRTLIIKPEFYRKVQYIFIEAFSINTQPHIDAYLSSEPENVKQLYPVFQNDFSGTGWPLQTYFDLLHTIYIINQKLPDSEKLQVIAVNAPTYWSQVHTPRDVQLFRKSLAGNDYTMYRIILSEMDDFASSKKGVFLTNTRHAYKGIRDLNGNLFWNCGTFFHQRHPGKTYAIRFHHLTLSVSREKEVSENEAATTAGMEKMEYKWVRMENGLWDSAFNYMENKPVAFPLSNNVYGTAEYTGNHMYMAQAGQTMFDAYDGLIFLCPLEELHNSAIVDFIYTPAFKMELERRYKILYTEKQLKNMIESNNTTNLSELIDFECRAEQVKLIPQIKMLGPLDDWQR